MTDALAVKMASVTKRFGAIVANSAASLTVRQGEIHAIVGENGAGKSTLMKILAGLVHADEGTIEVLGRALSRPSPSDAIRAGVGMVFQHFALVPARTVAENVVLGAEPVRFGFLFDRRRAEDEVESLARAAGLPLDPTAEVGACPVGIQQRVEIVKVLRRGAEVMVLDEPTAVLTPQEADDLIAVMKGLAARGKTIILITHKLREVMAAADRVTVMRRGSTMAVLEVSKTTPDEIAEHMIGRPLPILPRPPERPRGDPIIEIRGLVASSPRAARRPAAKGATKSAILGVDLTILGGEILGIAGVEGNGQNELVECIAGLRPIDSGTLRLLGVDVTRASVGERIRLGLSHIPADRLTRAVVLDFTLEENALLGLQNTLSSPLRLHRRAIRAHAERVLAARDVTPADPERRMRDLSGGNQQKLVVGRELSRVPTLILACHPTRGLDVGAAEQVLLALVAERQRGAAILFVTAELGELLAISDRISVMSGGRIVGEVDPKEVDERRLGRMMTGQAA